MKLTITKESFLDSIRLAFQAGRRYENDFIVCNDWSSMKDRITELNEDEYVAATEKRIDKYIESQNPKK